MAHAKHGTEPLPWRNAAHRTLTLLYTVMKGPLADWNLKKTRECASELDMACTMTRSIIACCSSNASRRGREKERKREREERQRQTETEKGKEARAGDKGGGTKKER